MTNLRYVLLAGLLAALSGQARPESLKIGPARLDTQSAAAQRDREGTHEVRDLKCPGGARLTLIEAQSSYWQLNRSITWVRLTCTLDGGIKTTPEAGTRRTPSVNDALSYAPWGACNRADGGESDRGQYMTGIRAFDDHYTKNLRIQCGFATVDPSARTFRITQRQLGYTNVLNVLVHDDDRAATLACAEDEVLTGLKLRYRKDGNESAFTFIQPYCSKVTVEP